MYALLDSKPIVNTPHLYAALSLWEYSVESVKWIFGDKVGDPIADAILEAVRRSEEGLTDTDLSNLFSRHESAERLSQAKSYLQTQNLIEPIPQATRGRPSVVWVAKKAKEAKKGND